MTRQSSDEVKDGLAFNGFDYELQVWVVEGIIQRCGHRRVPGRVGFDCLADRYAGRSLVNVLAERGIAKARGR